MDRKNIILSLTAALGGTAGISFWLIRRNILKKADKMILDYDQTRDMFFDSRKAGQDYFTKQHLKKINRIAINYELFYQRYQLFLKNDYPATLPVPDYADPKSMQNA